MSNTEPLQDEEDLDRRRARDDYNIERVVKFTFLVVFIVLILVIFGAFLYKFFLDQNFQNGVLDLVKQNISGIIFFAISVLGLNKFLKK
jgi:hypothetical protein